MKKSFIAYNDWGVVFNELSDEESGKLVKHLFNYVNGIENKPSDRVTELLFIQIKQTLNRDVEKYENIINRNKINGSKGGRPTNPNKPKKPSGLFGNPNKPKKPDSDSDSVSDSVNENDNDIIKKNNNTKLFNFRKSLIDLGVDVKLADDWMKVRRNKKATNTQTSFNKIKKQIAITTLSANECIQVAVEKDWRGFEAAWLQNIKEKNNNQGLTPLNTFTNG